MGLQSYKSYIGFLTLLPDAVIKEVKSELDSSEKNREVDFRLIQSSYVDKRPMTLIPCFTDGQTFSGDRVNGVVRPRSRRWDRGPGTADRKRPKALQTGAWGEFAGSWLSPPKKQSRDAHSPAARLSRSLQR